MNVVIRELQAEDYRDLQANCFVRDSLDDTKARVENNIERMVCGEIISLVAVLDREVIGNLVVTKNTHPLFAHRATIHDVVVCYRFWRHGICRQLFVAAFELAKSDGITLIDVSVRGGEPAEEVYRRLGFKEYGRLPNGIVEPWSGNVFDQVFLFAEA